MNILGPLNLKIFIYLLIFSASFLLSYSLVHLFFSLGKDLANLYRRYQTEQTEKISAALEESFIWPEKKKLALITVLPILFGLFGFVLFKHPLALLIGLGLGFSLPGVFIKILKNNRIKRFQHQLVDSLMILSSSLKAGLSFMQAIEVLVEEMPPPISQEFSLVLKETRLGISLDESLKAMRKRIPLEEVNLMVTSILVARETGGELTQVFSRLTETIRNNLKLKAKIATLTLQGRMQGMIMMVLPILFSFFVYQQDHEHFNVMLETSLGRSLLLIAVVLQVVGMILIKKISTIRT